MSAVMEAHNAAPYTLPANTPKWCAYLLGFLLVLKEEKGFDLVACRGFKVFVTSNVPRGAGVSSSARYVDEGEATGSCARVSV